MYGKISLIRLVKETSFYHDFSFKHWVERKKTSDDLLSVTVYETKWSVTDTQKDPISKVSYSTFFFNTHTFSPPLSHSLLCMTLRLSLCLPRLKIWTPNTKVYKLYTIHFSTLEGLLLTTDSLHLPHGDVTNSSTKRTLRLHPLYNHSLQPSCLPTNTISEVIRSWGLRRRYSFIEDECKFVCKWTHLSEDEVKKR